MTNADYLSAIEKRCSRRKYLPKPIEQEKCQRLQESIDAYNKESGLNMKLILGKGGELFDGFKKSYGMFVGVKNYIALIGKADDPNRMEKAGYYGERLILEATHMGLSSCWVGTNYDKNACLALLDDDEVVDCVITIGYTGEKHSLKEKFMEKNMHKNSKKTESLMEVSGEVPQWFRKGMYAVSKAPSARNLMPFSFRYDKGTVTARVTAEAERVMVDLGIAKLHFELGVGGGSWDYGDGAKYNP